MTKELEKAIRHIKTRADAWAVKEIEKALEQDCDKDCENCDRCVDNKCPNDGMPRIINPSVKEPFNTMSISSIVETVATKVTEDTEKFIFETIKPYCEEITKREISKKDLKKALTQYFSKEPCDEWQDGYLQGVETTAKEFKCENEI